MDIVYCLMKLLYPVVMDLEILYLIELFQGLALKLVSCGTWALLYIKLVNCWAPRISWLGTFGLLVIFVRPQPSIPSSIRVQRYPYLTLCNPKEIGRVY